MHFRFPENLKMVLGRHEPSDKLKLLPTDDGDGIEPPRPGPTLELEFKRTLVERSTALAVAAVVIVATVVTALFPSVIVRTLNDDRGTIDAYCYVFFLSFACLAVLASTVGTMKLLGFLQTRGTALPFTSIVKLSFYLSFGVLAVFYGRYRFRVPCHLQEPLMATLLPFGVICHLFVSATVDNVCKLSSLALVIVGLFICVEFQVLNEFSCPAHVAGVLDGQGMFWTSDEHAVWTVVCLVGVLFLALFFAQLHRSMSSSRADSVLCTVPTIECSSHTVTFNLIDSLVLCTWIQLFNAITIALLFWIDLFSFFGRTESMSTFQGMMLHGLGCFMGMGSEQCATGLSVVVWTFTILCAILLVAVVHLMVTSMDTCSSAYVLAVVTLALPLNTLWSSLLHIDGEGDDGLRWSPRLNGETMFTLVGLPIMITGLVLYRYLGNRPKSPTCNA